MAVVAEVVVVVLVTAVAVAAVPLHHLQYCPPPPHQQLLAPKHLVRVVSHPHLHPLRHRPRHRLQPVPPRTKLSVKSRKTAVNKKRSSGRGPVVGDWNRQPIQIVDNILIRPQVKKKIQSCF